jgi:hypothetical protein
MDSTRDDAIESISSMKKIQGDAVFAFRKISRIAFSLSPTHLLNTSGPFIEIKLASLSVAAARASRFYRILEVHTIILLFSEQPPFV